eukprot:PhF_6_TR5093/c0_g1_i2/m.7163
MSSSPPPPAPPAADPTLLTDAQLQQFIAEGYLVLTPSTMTPSDHAVIHSKLDVIINGYNNPGNNVVPQIPEFEKLLNDSVVKGALTSVLGESYVLQPHRFPHVNAPGTRDQVLHVDSYFGFQKLHHHNPWDAMIFYFPHDVSIDMGPTVLLPYSQYSTKNHNRQESEELKESKLAGTCVLIHYNIWHRGSINTSLNDRCMVKLQFLRMEAPVSGKPSWNHTSKDWVYNVPPATKANALSSVVHPSMVPVWQSVWQWYRGAPSDGVTAPPSTPSSWQALLDLLKNPSDDVPDTTYIGAAYTLALESDPACADEVLTLLMTCPKWDHDFWKQARDINAVTHSPGYYAAMVLCATPPDAPHRTPHLLKALMGANEVEARAHAAHALGTHLIRDGGVVKALLGVLRNMEEDILVVRSAVDALRNVSSEVLASAEGAEVVRCLADFVGRPDRDNQLCWMSSLTIAQLGPRIPTSVVEATNLVSVLQISEGTHPNRYVRGFSAMAHARLCKVSGDGISGGSSVEANLVMQRRICPLTSPRSPW